MTSNDTNPQTYLLTGEQVDMLRYAIIQSDHSTGQTFLHDLRVVESWLADHGRGGVTIHVGAEVTS